MNAIYTIYDLALSDKIRIVRIVTNMIGSDINTKVNFILSETKLIENLFSCLEEKK